MGKASNRKWRAQPEAVGGTEAPRVIAPKGPYGKLLDQAAASGPETWRSQRIDLIKKIESIRHRPLVIYATNSNISLPGLPAFIHREDLIPLSEILDSAEGTSLDFLIETPGGLAEVAEEIVGLLRHRFSDVAFIIPNQAMSAGTILVMSGNDILMDYRSCLGP